MKRKGKGPAKRAHPPAQPDPRPQSSTFLVVGHDDRFCVNTVKYFFALPPMNQAKRIRLTKAQRHYKISGVVT